MPELPEVEHFRQILQPLVSSDRTRPLSLELHNDSLPRKWSSPEELMSLSENYYCTNVRRKGKLLCMVLEKNAAAPDDSSIPNTTTKYLYLHMGMTGRVTAPGRITVLENVKDDGSVFPPPYTYLMMQVEDYPVAFCDPRKFSVCQLSDSAEPFEELAPDALACDVEEVVGKLANQTMGIKAILLDQKRAVSGVGNWVADELFYQMECHPDQTHLSVDQAQELVRRLKLILQSAIVCLERNEQYPDTWLFNYRWTKKKAGSDHKGRPLTFLTSGGRTSAIVASIQKIRRRKVKEKEAKTTKSTGKRIRNGEVEQQDEVLVELSVTKRSSARLRKGAK